MADVGVKLNVSGVSQFKSAMNTAKSSVKQLDAELKLNAAQYKASGDAEEYMAGRSRILSQQIKAQEDVVSNCQKALEQMASQGVDKASTSYTNMATQLAKAKTDLIQMQQAAQGAGEEMEKVGESTDKTAAGLEKIGHGINFQNVTMALDKIDRLLKNMFKNAWNIGKAIVNWEKDSSDWADQLITDATMFGLDTETLQRFNHAAQLIDTDVETIVKAQDKLLSKTGSTDGIFATLITGNSQYAIKVRESNGALRDQSDVLWDFLDILQKVDNETDRNALAQEYFGKSYRQMVPLIEAGREAWDEAAASASVVSDENVRKLGELNDKWVELENKIDAFKLSVAAELAPAMGTVLDAVGLVSDKFMAWVQSPEGQAALQNLGNAVAGLVESVGDINWNKVFEGATDAVNKIADFIDHITASDIKTALEVIGGIIGGWKVGTELLEFMVFAKAFKGLGGGSGVGAGAGAGASSGGSTVGKFVSNAAQAAGSYFVATKVLDFVAEKLPEEGWGNVFKAGIKGARANKSVAAVSDEITEIIKDEEEVLSDLQDFTEATVGKTAKRGGTVIPGQESYIDKVLDFAEDLFGAGKPSGAHEASLDEVLREMQPQSMPTDAELAEMKEQAAAGLETFDFLAGLNKKTEEAASTFGDDFYQAVLDSVKAARMDKNYADILDEVYDAREMDAQGWRNYISYYNARQAAEVLHNGGTIAPELLEFNGLDMDLVNKLWKNLFPEDFESKLSFGDQLVEIAAQAGEDASGAFGEGVMSNVEAAFAAGAALAAAFASGAASVRPAGGGDTTNNFNSVGSVNVYGAQSPAEIADAYNSYLAGQKAGYGG